MSNENSQTQGKVLLLLCNRSGLKRDVIAKNLEIHPSHLAKLFKSEVLTSKIKKRAATYFGVEESVFQTRLSYHLDLGSAPLQLKEEGDTDDSDLGKGPATKADLWSHIRFLIRTHEEERSRFLSIIEQLTKK